MERACFLIPLLCEWSPSSSWVIVPNETCKGFRSQNVVRGTVTVHSRLAPRRESGHCHRRSGGSVRQEVVDHGGHDFLKSVPNLLD
jgi:hypothetical protein